MPKSRDPLYTLGTLKIAILGWPQLGHGDVPRPQICAVDIPLRLLVVSQLSAQTAQIARKYGPLENAIFVFLKILAKIDFF